MNCSLCACEASPTLRISGLDLCEDCCQADPSEALAQRGLPVEFDDRLGYFSAGAGISHADPEFHISCRPELFVHKLEKLVHAEVQVGDPAFDDRVFIRTSKPGLAAHVLADEGVQSALLALLSGLMVDDLPNHVSFETGSLRIQTRPQGGLPPELFQQLKLETAALLVGMDRRLRG